MPYERKAQKTSHLAITLNEPDTKDGMAAFRRGLAYRRHKVEQRLLRMIVRQEIPVLIYDEHAQGLPISDQLRLNADLCFSIGNNEIGYNDLEPGFAWTFSTDYMAVWEALDGDVAWSTKKSQHDWLSAERYLRELIETRGLPAVQDSYHTETVTWYSAHCIAGHEPPASDFRNLVSRLCKEYSFSEI